MDAKRNDNDPYHPIIDRPWEYDIVELCYFRNPVDSTRARLDLTLQKDAVTRRLRFLGVQSLTIDEGFPIRTCGLCIVDVSRQQLDGLKVRVDDFEACFGKVRFWARGVIDRDKGSND